MDEVVCRGNETSLWKCSHDKKSDCSHREDISVRCNPLTIEKQKIQRRRKVSISSRCWHIFGQQREFFKIDYYILRSNSVVDHQCSHFRSHISPLFR